MSLLPESMSSVGFWVKFVPIFAILVVVPVFFLDFTDSLSFFTKILFLIGGGAGVVIALNGKSINVHKRRQQ